MKSTDEQELQELFDRTAADANGPALERLARAAGAVGSARTPQRSARWAWVPAVLAVAAGAAFVWRASGEDRGERVETRERTPAIARSGAPIRPREVIATSRETASESSDDDVTDVLDDLALDPGDLSDAELDAWISAAGSTLDG